MKDDKIFSEPYENWAQPIYFQRESHRHSRVRFILKKIVIVFLVCFSLISMAEILLQLGYPHFDNSMHFFMLFQFAVILLFILLVAIVKFGSKFHWLDREKADIFIFRFFIPTGIAMYLLVSCNAIWLTNSGFDFRNSYSVNASVTKLNVKENRGKYRYRNIIYLTIAGDSGMLEVRDEAGRFFKTLKEGSLVQIEVGKGLFGMPYVRDIRPM